MSSFLKSVAGKGGLAGIALSVGFFFVKRVVQKKGMSTNIKYLVESHLHNNIEQKVLPDDVIRQADALGAVCEAHHPSPVRIAIDGVPGSGKSTLTKALSKRLGIEAVCLDHQNMDERLSFAQQPALYEHHRLLRTQDIDTFDAVIYIDQPVAISKHYILQRERGAYLVDIMNFDLLKRIGDTAFALADGPVIPVENSFVKIKIKPSTGYKVMEHLAGELRARGINDSRIATLTKEQQLFLLVEGDVRKGFMAYTNPAAYEKDFVVALLEGLSSVSKIGRFWR